MVISVQQTPSCLCLTLSCITLKNGHIYFKNAMENFKCRFGNFSVLWLVGLTERLFEGDTYEIGRGLLRKM